LQAHRQVAHEQRLGEGTRVPEAALGVLRLARLAGVDPFLVMAARARQRLRRFAILLHARLWDEPWHAGVTSAEQLALVADEQNSVVAEPASLFEVVRSRRQLGAIVPGHSDRRT